MVKFNLVKKVMTIIALTYNYSVDADDLLFSFSPLPSATENKSILFCFSFFFTLKEAYLWKNTPGKQAVARFTVFQVYNLRF